MKIQFDHNQTFQLEAISAIVDVFEGQPVATGRYEVNLAGDFGGALTELGRGNALTLDDTAILANVRAVQKRNGIAEAETLQGLNFSVEMETGTGKTYVYLRTIHELHRKYGWAKFIIVVPTVAIREGVLKNIELTKDHFSALYDNAPCDAWVYDSKQISRLRQFATANTLQILVMNTDAFNKSVNVIGIENDRLSGRKPLEFVQAARPVVILDEPQNMESEIAKKAIESLSPLFTLRYSATHRNLYNLMYRLDPVRAYNLGLVKHIEVASVTDEYNFNAPYIELQSVRATKTKITARAVVDVETATGVVRKAVTLELGADLERLSGGRELYAGYAVEEINAADGYVQFTNGIKVSAGERLGSDPDAVMRVQVHETVKYHLEKELSVLTALPEGQRLKVLSLFFIDRVANYHNADGKIRRWFVEAYEELSRKPHYGVLGLPPVDQVHNGYFSQSKDGPKDTSGTTAADDAAYELIMRDKERLMDRNEPLRFIFSHSALREGWDNPNVFVICTLRESRSELKKRQEIGRGLRLPVDETGVRVTNEAVNRLTVVANESYKSFASALQSEIETEAGVSFSEKIQDARKKKKARLVKGWRDNKEFLELWDRIKHKTRYSVDYETDHLIRKGIEAIDRMPAIHMPSIRTETTLLTMTDEGIDGVQQSAREDGSVYGRHPIPDLITHLQHETELTRGTLARILTGSKRLPEVATNPQQFLYHATRALQMALHDLMIEGIKYERIDGEAWDMMLFKSQEIEGYISRMLEVKNSLYDAIEYESGTEKAFATALSQREDIKFFLKLPRWFQVETPIGKYNPDWAIVKQNAGEEPRLYLVRETKGTDDVYQLRGSEWGKIRCGEAHFKALPEVDFKRAVSADEV